MSTPGLGHHRIGDYLWYTTFERNYFLSCFGSDEDFKNNIKTHQDFLGLITFLHESYHLVQDLTLGLCIWVHLTTDELAITNYLLAKQLKLKNSGLPLSEFVNEGLRDLAQHADFLFIENQLLDDIIYTSKITDFILDHECRSNPEILSNLKSAYGLTGQDLLECHVAILTEFYVSRLIVKRAQAFSKAIIEDLEQYFRVDKIPACQKVLKIFHEKVGRFVKFDKANRQHPLYPECDRAAEYGFLLFLLDYSLHTCPLRNEGGDLSGLEDIVPTTRFLKLVGSVMPCILDMPNQDEFVLSESYLYTKFMQRLSDFNNRCNSEVSASPGSRKDTFLPYSDITKRLQTLLAEISILASGVGLISLFNPFYQLRSKALSLVAKDSLHVYRTNIFDLATEIGFIPLESTNNRVGCAIFPFITQGENQDGQTVYHIPKDPTVLMDDYLRREIFLELTDKLFNDVDFECPLAKKELTFYPCKNRCEICKSIRHITSIPQCFAKEVLEEFYPNWKDL